MLSIGYKLDQTKGIGQGFDFLRIFLAACVLFTHSFLIAEGENRQFSAHPGRLLHDSILPLFFALSGFLITGSAMRLKLKDFLINRGMRIVPALAVDICIAALIIGPVFTTLPLTEYFTSRQFLTYLLNITGFIHYLLPGVFEHTPFPLIVNGSLWTVPYEIGCYAIMSAFIISGILRRKRLAVGLSIVATILIFWQLSDKAALYSYFIAGSMFYLFRYNIAFNPRLLVACIGIFSIAAYGQCESLPKVLQDIIVMPALVYILVYIGLLKIPPLPISHRGDYSYGVYLYGYPIQQVLVTLFPSITSPLLHFVICLPLVTLIAMLSWHCIEKPILRLRKKFSFTARKGDTVQAIPLINSGR